VHSGFELAERLPINTGLDFTAEELKDLPSEKLPLFSEYAYDWLREEEFSRFVAKVLALRRRYGNHVADPKPETFKVLAASHDHTLAFARIWESLRKRVAIVGTTDFQGGSEIAIPVESSKRRITDLLSGKEHQIHDHHLNVKLKPGQCLIFEF